MKHDFVARKSEETLIVNDGDNGLFVFRAFRADCDPSVLGIQGKVIDVLK